MATKSGKRHKRKCRRRARAMLTGKNKPRPHKRIGGRTGKILQGKIKAANGGRAAQKAIGDG